MAQALDFFSGLLQGFAQTQERQRLSKQDEEERKARVKLYEIQIAREKAAEAAGLQQQDALKQLFGQFQPSAAPAAPPNGIPGTAGPVAAPGGQTPSLTQLLADPKNAMLLLQSGLLKGEDLLKQGQGNAQRAMIEKLMGGGAGGTGTNGMQLQGVKIGPSGEIMPDFGLPQVTSPQTVMGPNGPELATFDPRTGKRVASLGTPKPDTVTPDTAGRISGLQQAQEIATNVMSKFVIQGADGAPKVDRQLVLTAFGRVPGTEGRKIRDDLSIAIDSVLRARTGAGVNKEEMKQVVDQFLPHPFDSDAEIINKAQRLQQFIGGALDTVTLPPGVQKRIQGSSGKALNYDPATGTFK
ncbi:MAG TPA: hypothetical protein VIW26_16615 [Gemmatimonadales bacterium]|jgi:hypothetical protein